MILGSFIDSALCDEIIRYFECDWISKSEGVCGDLIVEVESKKSIDAVLSGPLLQTYEKELLTVLKNYVNAFPEVNSVMDTWGIAESVMIQKYNPPDGGYHVLHCENGGKSTAFRTFVFMTYLNDVTEDGETFFPNQNFKCKPQKGLTLIWPAYVSYIHKGMPSPQTKYIVTGWFSYL